MKVKDIRVQLESMLKKYKHVNFDELTFYQLSCINMFLDKLKKRMSKENLLILIWAIESKTTLFSGYGNSNKLSDFQYNLREF